MSCACSKIGKMKNPFKNFDFVDAAITVASVTAGNYAAGPIGTQIQKIVPATWTAQTSSKVVNGAKVVLGIATPAIIASVTKDKTAMKAAIGFGAGMIADGGKGLAKDFGIITGPYQGLQTRYIRTGVTGSPQNQTMVAGRMNGSPDNFTSVAGAKVGQGMYRAV